ncbi:hypothetical protein NicSoilB4_30500 [Arthrobacter sp. NicSoilB4]|uniref:hypothetical protein n=1 Tax=Arthrobacter sp. NicSoilB4 TaxID=2830997 RepID=UPI001CC4BCE7|nr:hypothetical protein [Arthrobacter sp. NicSoilB4]BCW68287.1 hypothetical protein NicSoilB4_30500 [Arthrobacter sp. NicSoilB4]
MNEQANGQLKQPAQSQGNAGAERPTGYGDAPRFTVDKASSKPVGKKNEAVLGPFTVRDLTVFGSTLILFVASLIPMFAVRYNLWNLGSLFFLGLGIILPVIVAALFVARRVSPGTKMRVGSLSVDQFGSVVASFAVAFFFLSIAGAFVPSMLLALVGALGLLSATVLGRLIPFFAGDFLDRAEVPAHIVARDAAVPVRKPRAPKAPKAATEEKAPKAAGTSAVAGWAKRMTPGGQSAATEPAPRGDASFGAAAGAAGAAAASGAAARSAAPTPAPAQQAPTQSAPTPVVSAPETQAAAVVPAASAPEAPSAAEQTQAAAVVPPAAKSAAGGQAPDAQARAASAAEDTRAAEVPAAASHSAPTTVNPQVRQQEPIGATVDPSSRPEDHEAQPVHEAFWFAVAQPRTAMDEHSGAAAFVIEPGGWVLALEDRGHEFLVQHTDGRVGVLRDLSNIERG